MTRDWPKRLRNQKDFLEAFDLSTEQYANSGYNWHELGKIYSNYAEEWIEPFEGEGKHWREVVAGIPRVQAVSSRPKHPEGLIAKLIRKSAETGAKYADESNYRAKVPDLIGVRALHVFKEDWIAIHAKLKSYCDVVRKPEANVAENDPEHFKKMYENGGCELKERTDGYRSIHYAIRVKCRNLEMLAELQVRTLFEEAWGEMSHQIDYPKRASASSVRDYLQAGGQLAGTSDGISFCAYKLFLFTEGKVKGTKARKAHQEFREVANFIYEENPWLAQLTISPGDIPLALLKKGTS